MENHVVNIKGVTFKMVFLFEGWTEEFGLWSEHPA